jgi:hypothetical protein
VAIRPLSWLFAFTRRESFLCVYNFVCRSGILLVQCALHILNVCPNWSRWFPFSDCPLQRSDKQVSQVGVEVTRRNLDILPTIIVKLDAVFFVRVEKDLLFKAPNSTMPFRE